MYGLVLRDIKCIRGRIESSDSILQVSAIICNIVTELLHLLRHCSISQRDTQKPCLTQIITSQNIHNNMKEFDDKHAPLEIITWFSKFSHFFFLVLYSFQVKNIRQTTITHQNKSVEIRKIFLFLFLLQLVAGNDRYCDAVFAIIEVEFTFQPAICMYAFVITLLIACKQRRVCIYIFCSQCLSIKSECIVYTLLLMQ